MIAAREVMVLLLDAVPSFEPVWLAVQQAHDAPETEQGRLHYLDAGRMATHLVSRLEVGDTDEVAAAFRVLEQLHLDGDAYVRELATIGYLEDIQNAASRSDDVQPDDFLPFLGEQSARWWRGLDAFWSGEPPPVRPIG